MSRESRMLAGILLVVLPTVMYGGLTLLVVCSPEMRRGMLIIRCDKISGAPDIATLESTSSFR
jgi:hypothetical protein